MDQPECPAEAFSCWISSQEHIITFHETNGYEQRSFQDHADFWHFVLLIVSNDYRVL